MDNDTSKYFNMFRRKIARIVGSRCHVEQIFLFLKRGTFVNIVKQAVHNMQNIMYISYEKSDEQL